MCVKYNISNVRLLHMPSKMLSMSFVDPDGVRQTKVMLYNRYRNNIMNMVMKYRKGSCHAK